MIKPHGLSLFLYRVATALYFLFLDLAAAFHPKAAKRKQGLANQVVEPCTSKQTVWVHCASAGEFEQVRPILEALKKDTDVHLAVSFFSASGVEAHKKNTLIDAVYYLPADHPKQAESWIAQLQPNLALFVRYEHWYFHLKALNQKDIPVFLVAATFRKNQAFFKKPHALYSVFPAMLSMYTERFVRDTTDKERLAQLSLTSVVSGDPRFDRVVAIAEQGKPPLKLTDWSKDHTVLVAGSTWPKDIDVLATWWQNANRPFTQLLIVPHELSEAGLARIEETFPKAQRYTQHETLTSDVVILNTTGMLSTCYQLGQVAYIGGGFGTSVHNVLEAAVYGIPLYYGPATNKQPEAGELLALGSARLAQKDIQWQGKDHPQNWENRGKTAREYVYKHKGSTQIILNTLKPLFFSGN